MFCIVIGIFNVFLTMCFSGNVVKLAVVSNFDSRLRPILRDLQVDNL
jgi:hypothetical protein